MIEPLLPLGSCQEPTSQLGVVAFGNLARHDGGLRVQPRAARSEFFLRALETAARLTSWTTLAVVERVPGRRAIRWLCGSGALTSAADLDAVLSLLPEPHGGLQVNQGAALVPLGLNHAVIIVGATREVATARLQMLEQIFDRLLTHGLRSPALANVA